MLRKGHIFAILGISLAGLLILSLQFESAYGLEILSIDQELQVNEYWSYSFEAPQYAKQFINITGDSFLVELQTPRGGLQINDEQFKKELTIEWVHLLDGKSSLSITNTGNTLVRISGTLETSDVSILVDEPAGMGFYENTLYDFSFEVPTDWRYQEDVAGADGSIIQVMIYPDGFNPLVNIDTPHIIVGFENVPESDVPRLGAKELENYHIESIRTDFEAGKIIDTDSKDKSFGWVVHTNFIFSQNFGFDIIGKYKTEQYAFHFKDRESYTIAYFATDDYFNTYYSVFEDAVDSLEIRGIKVNEPEPILGIIPTEKTSDGGGCLIATATFGTELAPQVQQLRELRDNYLLKTESGSSFMVGFNELYYSFSPTIADLERQSPIFKEAVKLTITPLITSLSLLNYADIDSEVQVLGYGISLIILNVGMYFVAPVGIVVLVRRKF